MDSLFSPEALLAARTRAGLTQSQLARRIDVAGGERISAWEAGRAAPKNPKLIHALADALDVRVEELLIVPAHGPDLRWLRTVAGLLIEDLSAAVNISVTTLRRWELHGLRRAPSASTVTALAKVLHAPPSVVQDALRR